MFNRMKNALYNAVGGGFEALPSSDSSTTSHDRTTAKFRYTRPLFLQLNSDDEIQVSADHVIRPIIVPRDITKLPWNSGYAEAINAGKSIRNEDQASMYRGTLHKTLLTIVTPVSTPVRQPSEVEIAKPEAIPSPVEPTDVPNPAPSATVEAVENSQEKPVTSSAGDSTFATPPSSPNLERKTISPKNEKEKTDMSMKANNMVEQTIPWIYFGLFDGHAGSGAAVVAANMLFRIIEEKLNAITDFLLPYSNNPECNVTAEIGYTATEKHLSKDSLVAGALESAFWEMDQQIGRDKQHFRVTGGCTAVVGVFFLGKLYVANAGDSRAIFCSGNTAIPLSNDFTPESERDRIRYLGLLRPELLGNEFTHLEYIRRPVRKDLGKRMLYRDGYMNGWAYKTIGTEDLKFPLIYGEGKRSRVLATIGVTRGFGDHDLKAQTTDVDIKPFLSAQPEVRIVDLMNMVLTDSDVLVMGTDGLWDITANETAASIVQKSLDHFPANDNQRYKYRYISAAQDLVMHSRGKLRERNWKTVDNKPATIDDISVFVIPLKPYKEEFLQWKTYVETMELKSTQNKS